MIKLAANYVVADSGAFLKNGIVLAENDGSVLEYVDTGGALEEMARLTFYNGILLAGFSFLRMREMESVSDSDDRFSSVILNEIGALNEISILKWLEICKKIPAYFPDMIIAEIFRRISDMLCSEGGFRKEISPGIYLLSGTELGVLKLSANCKIKRIL